MDAYSDGKLRLVLACADAKLSIVRNPRRLKYDLRRRPEDVFTVGTSQRPWPPRPATRRGRAQPRGAHLMRHPPSDADRALTRTVALHVRGARAALLRPTLCGRLKLCCGRQRTRSARIMACASFQKVTQLR